MSNEITKALNEPETFPIHVDMMLTALDNKIEVYKKYVANLEILMAVIKNRAENFYEGDQSVQEFAGDVTQYIMNSIEGAQHAAAFTQAQLSEIQSQADSFIQIERTAPQSGVTL